MPANKTPQEKLQFVRQHIEQFPRYESHYSRNDNPHRFFLSPSLSVTKMYHLYKDQCAETGKEYVSEWYREVFNTEFNLSFGRCVNCLRMVIYQECRKMSFHGGGAPSLAYMRMYMYFNAHSLAPAIASW